MDNQKRTASPDYSGLNAQNAEAAIQFVEIFKLPVLPCRIAEETIKGTKYSPKSPHVPRYIKEGVVSTDPETIRAWAKKYTKSGCVFGCCPGPDYAVLDIDAHSEKNGFDSLKTNPELNDCDPRGLSVATPSGGLHLWMRDSKHALLGGKNGILTGVDIRGGVPREGFYVIVPGMKISDKKGYTTLDKTPTDEIPAKLAEFANAKLKRNSGTKANAPKDEHPGDQRNFALALNEIRDMAPVLHENGRDDELNKLGFAWYTKYGLNAASIFALFRVMNDLGKIEQIPGDEKDDGDFKRIAESISRSSSALGGSDPTGLFNALPESEEPPFAAFGRKEKSKPISVTELMKRPEPELKWYIRPWLSEEEGFTVLYTGKGGAGKSLSAVALMHSLATGEPWFGIPIQKRAKCLFVTCEENEDIVLKRLYGASKNGDFGDKDDLAHIWPKLGEEASLCKFDKNGKALRGEFYNDLYAECDAFFGKSPERGGGVLILDTLTDTFDGNENDRVQAACFVKRVLACLGREFGLSIVVLAHPAKGISGSVQKPQDVGYSGSSAWEGSFRCRWELSAKSGPDVNGVSILELMIAKSNYGPSLIKIGIRNNNGRLESFDAAKIDTSLDEAVFREIERAYSAGIPFTKFKTSTEFVGKMRVKSPIGESNAPESEILASVDRLWNAGRIEDCLVRKKSSYRPKVQTA